MAKAGLTETALAAQVEVDAKTVDRLRNEGAIPRRPQVKAKVADILGLDQDDLSYLHQGRKERLPLVEGKIIEDVV